jgi:hypothetical protein
MDAMDILRDNLIKSKKLQNPVNKGKKDIDEIDLVTEVFLYAISAECTEWHNYTKAMMQCC